MAVTWTLEIDGVTKTLAEWGLASVTLRRVNMGVDTLTAVRVVQTVDEEPLCDYGDTVRLFRTEDASRVKWFEGTRALIPGDAGAGNESQSYLFEGPWAFLARNVYRQTWTGGIGGVLQTIWTSHVIISGTVAQQVAAVLNYARNQLGASLSIGTLTAPIAPPMDEVTDRTCAAVITDAAKWAPDCVGWFDYRTTPPTFHLQPRSALPAVTLKMPDIRSDADLRMEGLRVTPRPDIQVPSVELTFEIASQVDGETKFGFVRQRYPVTATGFEDGCLAAVVSLQGFNATTVRATLEGEEIDTTSLEWWKKVIPKLRDKDVTNLALHPESVIRTDDFTGEVITEGLPQRLISGTAAEWQINPDGTSVQWRKEVIGAQFTYLRGDAVLGEAKPHTEEYNAVNVVTTNAPEGETDYEALATFESGEAVPFGLAQYLYDSLHPLHYDVSVTLVEEDPKGRVAVGDVLNVSGSRAEYASMNALVQEVTIQIDTGRTSLVAGPPKHLSLSDLLALLRANRVRRRWTNPATQSTGDIGGSGSEINMGQGTGDTNATHTEGPKEKLVVRKLTGANLRKIELNCQNPYRILIRDSEGREVEMNLNDCIGGTPPSPRRLWIQPVRVCIAGDDNWVRLIVCSEPFRPPAT